VGQGPDEIREQIEETRARMGDTVEAIGYKADVKQRTSDWVADKKDAVVGRVKGATPDTGQMREGAQRGVGMAKENPIGLAVGGVAVGFLVGLLIPSTRVEDERMGEVADQVKDSVRETGQEALERGKQVAQEAGQSAAQTARESGREQGQELSESLKEGVQDARETTSPSS
jgi:gas vesicle protein